MKVRMAFLFQICFHVTFKLKVSMTVYAELLLHIILSFRFPGASVPRLLGFKRDHDTPSIQNQVGTVSA